MVLAFGSHYVSDASPNAPLHDTEGWKYFVSAHDKLPDLLQGSNLSALQGLLLIVSLFGLICIFWSCSLQALLFANNAVLPRFNIFSLPAGHRDGYSWELVLRWLKPLVYIATHMACI
jgi:hypothetical protein